MHLQKQKKHWLIRLNKVIVKRICLWQILFWVEARRKYKKIGKNHKKQLNSAEEYAPELFRNKYLRSLLSAVFRKLYSILHRVLFLFLTEDL